MTGIEEMRILVRSSDADVDDWAELARNLRSELLRLDIDDARPERAESLPAGAKSGEAIAIGALVVSMAPGLVPAVVDIVASWLKRQPTDISVDMDGQHLAGQVTPQQRDEIVAAYLRRLESKESS